MTEEDSFDKCAFWVCFILIVLFCWIYMWGDYTLNGVSFSTIGCKGLSRSEDSDKYDFIIQEEKYPEGKLRKLSDDRIGCDYGINSIYWLPIVLLFFFIVGLKWMK